MILIAPGRFGLVQGFVGMAHHLLDAGLPLGVGHLGNAAA